MITDKKNDQSKLDFIIVIGIPSSGKSTVRNQIKKQYSELCVISPDEIRERMLNVSVTKKSYDPSIESYVWTEAKDKLEYCIEEKKHIFFDATNIKKALRNQFISKAKESGYTTKGIYLNIDPTLALFRQKNRERKVPEDVIYNMYYTMEKPTKDEFDILEIINKNAEKNECLKLNGTWDENSSNEYGRKCKMYYYI